MKLAQEVFIVMCVAEVDRVVDGVMASLELVAAVGDIPMHLPFPLFGLPLFLDLLQKGMLEVISLPGLTISNRLEGGLLALVLTVDAVLV